MSADGPNFSGAPQPPDIDRQVVRVTFFQRLTAVSLSEEYLTLPALRDLILSTKAPAKARLPWLKLATFGDVRTTNNCLRHDANVRGINGVEMDYDGERMTFDDAVAIVERAGLRSLIYTSPSHTEEAPRWRIVAPTTREMAPEERYRLAARINGAFGGIFADESFTLSQSYYYGSVKSNPEHRAVVIDGSMIDQRDDLDATAIGKRRKEKDAEVSDHPRGRGFEAHLASMGDGDGLEGFNMPLCRAAAAYAVQHGADFDRAVLKARLIETINDAPKKPGRDNIESKYLTDAYLDNAIITAIEKYADKRPIIRIAAGELPRQVEQIANVMIKAGGLYQHSYRLVRILWDKIKTTGGDADALRLSPVTLPFLLMRFAEVAQWQRWDKTAIADPEKPKEKGAWVPANVPEEAAKAYLALDGGWGVPRLLGIVTVPTLRPDGTIIDKPGYDEATGIFFDPVGVVFPSIPSAPTKAEAKAALALLKQPFRSYNFVTLADKAVALSGCMTAVIRTAMPVAPLHAFSAPLAGAGKSKIVDVASIIATGERAAVTATGKSEEELEKRLVASMLGGDRVIAIDNVEGGLGGEFLCQCVTQARVKPRVLGKSLNRQISNAATLFATGNNLTIIGDLTRRTLRGDIDPGSERPELEEFDFDPVEEAKQNRPALVAAVLTIVRAGIVAKDIDRLPPLGSFEVWSRFVRDTLIWLGEADPVEVLEKVRAADPRLENLRAVMVAWHERFGTDLTTVAAIIVKAEGRRDGIIILDEGDPELRGPLMGVAGDSKGNKINPGKLGWWLRKNMKRPVSIEDDDGKPMTYRFEQDEEHATAGRGVQWRLAGVFLQKRAAA